MVYAIVRRLPTDFVADRIVLLADASFNVSASVAVSGYLLRVSASVAMSVPQERVSVVVAVLRHQLRCRDIMDQYVAWFAVPIVTWCAQVGDWPVAPSSVVALTAWRF